MAVIRTNTGCAGLGGGVQVARGLSLKGDHLGGIGGSVRTVHSFWR